MPPITIGRGLAAIVFILAVVFAATGQMPLVAAGMFAAVAVAIIVT